MSENVLLTGATGFLGTELATRLVLLPNVKVYALVRSADAGEAYHRLRAAWHHDNALSAAIGERAIAVPGDFTLPHLGLSKENHIKLQELINLVIHAGAEIGFQKSQQELAATNIQGTENMLSFAAGLAHLRRFVYISTAYVSGTQKGTIRERETEGSSFSNHYEKSKACAESLVRASSLPFVICRPGMIVGDSQTGWAKNFNTVYYVLKLMLLGKLRLLPISASTALNIVPGDYVADAAIQISFAKDTDGQTFHLTCPKAAAPTAGELAAYVRAWAKTNLSLHLSKPLFLPLPLLRYLGIWYNKKGMAKKKGGLSSLLIILPYFFGDQEFDRTNTDKLCGPYTYDWRNYIESLLRFACRKNFMRQSGQSIFAQAQSRRASRRYPITYYDVSADGLQPTSGPQANARIEAAAAALWAWGVRPGDRIALTGINSVDYLVLDQAIGLLGAVSVPIYYTSPAQETSQLLAQSGASWFFIGDKRVMEQSHKLSTKARLVSFANAQSLGRPGVMSWEDFLKKETKPISVPLTDSLSNPEDLATIRYTSGTTGTPKGVMFNFGQLHWMGEALSDLLPWKERNRSVRYLSFLPLSHVVEGILASYAPYCLLAKVEVYYLNDFRDLAQELPTVRPTVFFSVPRFYEKLWEQVASSRLGQMWLAAKEGIYKRILAAVLRRAVLRRAGLDRCRQLIVGSAPMSEALLLRFRALGIEIHNAYGQTEAPLITINRLGDNIIPTVGTPLPDTEVTLADDGELIVKGPQVALGYYGRPADTMASGELHTGDLGTIHADGHISLYGRKKEMIVTAYGKNISIPKIEERLKNIPGVAEAVLIGENRPFCTALLWLEKESADLDGQIEQMNANLSHPEQIRKYRIISRPLSIQAGELTPNLKIKRNSVQDHFAAEIEEMYR